MLCIKKIMDWLRNEGDRKRKEETEKLKKTNVES